MDSDQRIQQKSLGRRALWLVAAAIVLGTGLSGCRERTRSRAAEVSDTDVRRLPPTRKAEVPDIMLDQSDRGRVFGSGTATVQLFVVSDYACEMCRFWFEHALPLIRDSYLSSGRVKLTWVHYPLREHPNSVRAASAALCAGVQGRFEDASARLFATSSRWGPAANANALIDSLGNVPGLDAFAYRDCVESGRLLRQIKADIDWADATNAGNPLRLVLGKSVLAPSVSYSALRASLDSALNAR